MRFLSRADRGAALFIDVIIAIAIFGILFGGILTALQRIGAAQVELKNRLTALFLMSSQFEKARSIPYASVGVVGGTVTGIFLNSEQITSNNTVFTRTTAVRHIDDAKDGIGASDTNNKPNDYKQMSVSVSWQLKGNTRSVRGSQYISNASVEP